MNSMQKPATPLINFFDLDPERLKPIAYPCNIEVPVGADQIGHNSITLRNQPLIITRITHGIIGNTADPESTGLHDDGQYSIEWKDEERNYTVLPMAADLLFGPKVQGEFPDLVYPIYFAGTHTLDFRITNHYTRVLTPEVDTFVVQIGLHGLCDYGKLARQG